MFERCSQTPTNGKCEQGSFSNGADLVLTDDIGTWEGGFDCSRSVNSVELND